MKEDDKRSGTPTMTINAAPEAEFSSWRLEATLIGIGFNTIDLPVERPPEEYETAVRVAAGHFAFCSDTGPAGTGHHSAARRGARRRS